MQEQLDLIHKPKYKSCELGMFIKDKMPMLMQLFHKELASYNMRMLTSKCLNTAIMIFYMFLGEEAIKHISYCDVKNVLQRYHLDQRQSLYKLHAFKKELLSTRNTHRKLFYVMITGGLVHQSHNGNTLKFPGHVFVIEKINRPHQLPSYIVYQSYIRNYKLKDHYLMNNNSLEYSYFTITEIVHGLQSLFTLGEWTKQTTRFWKKLAHADEANFEGYELKGFIHFCYRSIEVRHCFKVLKEKLKEKQKELKASPAKFQLQDIRFSNSRDGDYPLAPSKIEHELNLILHSSIA